MSEKKIFKPNVVYVIEIHGCLYYVGCHCWNCRKGVNRGGILNNSGNPLKLARMKKQITHQEYQDCCKLVHIEEYDTKEEALNREAELIKRFKSHYGNQCLNKTDGNIFGGKKGYPTTEETKYKLRKSHISQSKKVQQYTKEGQLVAEYSSIHEAWRKTGVSAGNICRYCQGKHKPTDNSIWKYAP